jgi:Arc/MetJ-type ribon-helix-helix transcriptional regulator
MTDEGPYVKLSISLPQAAAERVRAAVESGVAPNASAYIAESITGRATREDHLRRIMELRGGRPFDPDVLAQVYANLGIQQTSQQLDHQAGQGAA